MGRSKLALPLGSRCVLEQVIATLLQAGVEQVLVVVGPQSDDLRLLAEKAGAQVLSLPGDTPDMRATVERGLQWLEERFHPQPDDGWLLLPADHPTLDPNLIERLLAAWERRTGRTILLPTFGGKGGHPVLIGWRHVAGIRALPAGLGINVYLGQQRSQIWEIAVATPDILCDLDTPEDYERLTQAQKEKRKP
jgi:molybdenum cofactor cytidylyltransferase